MQGKSPSNMGKNLFSLSLYQKVTRLMGVAVEICGRAKVVLSDLRLKDVMEVVEEIRAAGG